MDFNKYNLNKKNCKNNSKKLNFKQKKKNTINSLFEVEHFLNNSKKISDFLKLYKIIKK